MKRTAAILLTLCLLFASFAIPAAANNKEADLIIIGAGAGGLSAALEAIASGAEKVLVLEMTARTGGALNFTSGSMSAAGTIIQKEENVEDSVESYVADIMNNGDDFGGKPNEALVRIYAENAAKAFDWLYENGVKNGFRPGAPRAVFAPEHALYSVPRTYKARAQNGEVYKSAAHEVLDTLVKAESKIEILFNTKAIELLSNEKGQITDVLAQGPNGNHLRCSSKKGVVVCTGGFSSNNKLMGKYAENGAYYLAGGAPGADGNGLLLMQNVGAAITQDAMSAIPTFPMGLVIKDNPGSGTIASTYTWKAGGIVVNQNGERFCNETESNPAVREVALEAQPKAVQYDIYTDKILADLAQAKSDYFMKAYFMGENPRGAHVMYTADSVEGLAEAIGVPKENLKKTIEEYNTAVESGKPDSFGRDFQQKPNAYHLSSNKIEGNALYAVRLHALCVMTLGGIQANENMQVLDENGSVIPGLYAAGEVVGGVWGKFVSSGTGVMGPIVFGKIAATHAMSSNMAEGYQPKPASNMLDKSLFEKEVRTEAAFDMSVPLKDGTYSASVDGQSGEMTVNVNIQNGKIIAVTIVSHHETEGIANPALESVTAAIVAANNPNVDAISGATLTSNRIMQAVIECLKQAAN